MDVGLKMLRIRDSATSLKLRDNYTSSSVRIITNETSSSEIEMVVENDTSSSNKTISNDIISFNMALPAVNDTTSSSKTTGINYNFSTNETMRNDSFSSITPLPDDDDTRMSSSKTPGMNYTSSFLNVAMSNDVISSNMSVPVVNERSGSSETLEINNRNSSQQVKGKRSPMSFGQQTYS